MDETAVVEYRIFVGVVRGSGAKEGSSEGSLA
jgi:hypothetical protein